MPEDQLPTYANVTTAQYFTLAGNNFRFAPIPDGGSTATISYFVKLPTLSGVGTATNWLLREHPDVYMYGTLLEASGKVRDPDLMTSYSNAVREVVSQIKNADARKRYGGNSMVVRVV
jgi:hypothetical protein